MRTKKGVEFPADLAKTLKSKAGLLAMFETMKPSCQIEYAEWVASAKNPEIRQRRIASVFKKTAEWGARRPAKPATKKASTLKRELHPMPPFVRKALASAGLIGKYEARPPYQQNDYIGWISRAVRDETKQKRLNQMLEELKAGGVYMKMAWKTNKPFIPDSEVGIGF